MAKNFVKKLREERLMSKTELARKAGLSPLTIARIETGKKCRMETKRKIILALGIKLSDKDKVFGIDKKIDERAELMAREPEHEKAAGSSTLRKAKKRKRPHPSGKASFRRKGRS